MEAGILWREEMQALHDAEFRDVELTYMPADNCAMQLVREPAPFDVIVTERSPARAHGSKRGGRRSISGIVPFYLEPPSSTLRIFDRAQRQFQHSGTLAVADFSPSGGARTISPRLGDSWNTRAFPRNRLSRN